ncbi:hypothetical protein [Mesorhizobium amorphae]
MAVGRADDAFGALAGLLASAGAFFAAGWAAVGFAVAAGLAAAAFGLAGVEAVLVAAVVEGFAALAFSTGFGTTAFAEDEVVFAASDFAAAGFAEALAACAFGLVALAVGAAAVFAVAAAVGFAVPVLGAAGFAAGLVAGAALAAAGLTDLLAAGVFVLAWVGFAAAGFVSAGALALAVDLTEPAVFVAFATCSSLDDMGRLDPSWAGAAAPCDWRCPRRKTLLPTMYCDYSFACKSCPNGSLAGICNRVPTTRWARPFPPQTAVGGFCTSTKDTGLHILVMSG